MNTLQYLVLLHIASGTPVGIEGPYATQLCSNVAHRREAMDQSRDDAVLARKGFGWICMEPALAKRIVVVYHCSVETTTKNYLGARATTYACLGQ